MKFSINHLLGITLGLAIYLSMTDIDKCIILRGKEFQNATRISTPTGVFYVGLKDRRNKVLDATVRVRVASRNRAKYGTGTVIGPGRILTCAHIFHKMEDPEITVLSYSKKQVHEGKIGYIHKPYDVAIITTPPLDIEPIQLASELKASVGQEVFVAGCDFAKLPEVRTTKITNISRFVNRPNLEVEAVPNSGRSGGGVFTKDHKLIGVCTGINPLSDTGLYSGVSFLTDEPTTIP